MEDRSQDLTITLDEGDGDPIIFQVPPEVYYQLQGAGRRAGRTVDEEAYYTIAVLAGLQSPDPGDLRMAGRFGEMAQQGRVDSPIDGWEKEEVLEDESAEEALFSTLPTFPAHTEHRPHNRRGERYDTPVWPITRLQASPRDESDTRTHPLRLYEAMELHIEIHVSTLKSSVMNSRCIRKYLPLLGDIPLE